MVGGTGTSGHRLPTAEQLLEGLDPQQREVAMQVAGPLVVRAGAGTGKTRAITYRIAYGAATGAVDPSTVLAVTFTSKAATEMSVRLAELGAASATASTFHSAALRQLSYFWPRVFGGSIPPVIPNKAPLVAAVAGRLGVATDRATVRDLAAEIEWTKVSLGDAETYADKVLQAGRVVPADLEPGQFADFLVAYQQAKDERGGIDFEDILLIMASILENDERVAAQVHSRYRSFVVDEYQDVSPIQKHLLDLWRAGRSDLCVVGDVAQTIYSFSGASAHYLEDFPKEMKGAKVVELVRDYRSTPQIVATANQVVSRSQGFDGRAKRQGLPGAVKLVAGKASGPAVAFVKYDSDQDEARGVADKIKDLADQGVKGSQIAILYRTNSQSEVLEEALEEAAIPYQVHGGARFFERDEVRQALLLLRQQERLLTLGEGQQPDGSLSQREDSLVQMVQNVVSTLGWSSNPPARGGKVAERWHNLDALVNLAKRRPHLNLKSFVSELQERAETKAAPEVAGVTLSTLHGAKGLEWKAVFLVGLSEGLLPISLAQTPEAVEEERRLLYVGITRAEEILQLSWAASRGEGRSGSRRLSQFLTPLWPQEEKTGRAGRPQKGRAKRKQEAADFEAQADSQTLALFADLKRWRLQESQAAGRPAFTVLTDTTLRDVASAKPVTLAQLGLLRGIGNVKLADYGAQILRIVAPYRDR